MKYFILIVSISSFIWFVNPIVQEKRDKQRCMSIHQKQSLSEFEIHGRGIGKLFPNEIAFLEAYKACH